jgi:hypothetical protein
MEASGMPMAEEHDPRAWRTALLMVLAAFILTMVLVALIDWVPHH